MAPRVVINDTKAVDHPVQRAILEGAGYAVETGDAADEAALRSLIDGAVGVITDAQTPFTAPVFESPEAAALRVVGRSGIGVDNIDLTAAGAADVTVVHVPDYCIDEVSTHAFGLLLSCVRTLPVYDRQTSAGDWDWEAGRPIHRLSDRTLGLLGFGRIGRRMATKSAPFVDGILAHDPYLQDAVFETAGVERVGFEALFERSQILSIHTPLTTETEGLVDAAALDRLPEGAIVVNTARGGIVDEAALADALAADQIRRAGIDVMAEEPPLDSPLLGRDDVLLTPHVAWYSEESRDELTRRVAEDVRRVLDGEPPRSPVSPETGW